LLKLDAFVVKVCPSLVRLIVTVSPLAVISSPSRDRPVWSMNVRFSACNAGGTRVAIINSKSIVRLFMRRKVWANERRRIRKVKSDKGQRRHFHSSTCV
jgi:hypothetical protein